MPVETENVQSSLQHWEYPGKVRHSWLHYHRIAEQSLYPSTYPNLMLSVNIYCNCRHKTSHNPDAVAEYCEDQWFLIFQNTEHHALEWNNYYQTHLNHHLLLVPSWSYRMQIRKSYHSDLVFSACDDYFKYYLNEIPSQSVTYLCPCSVFYP